MPKSKAAKRDKQYLKDVKQDILVTAEKSKHSDIKALFKEFDKLDKKMKKYGIELDLGMSE